ncbi:VOC family protein [Stackebrandtia soli]|uniref:VOC family protein n=1 Tax=Stackebrandtia soli TaxID=1892856 RepID=UPI0039EB5B4A
MAIQVGNITFNTPDPKRLADWWVSALGGKVTGDYGDYIFAEAGGVGLGFQRSDEQSGQRLHLDLAVDDAAVEVARLLELGATHVADREFSGAKWAVLKDIDGNEFCVSDSH